MTGAAIQPEQLLLPSGGVVKGKDLTPAYWEIPLKVSGNRAFLAFHATLASV